MYKNLSLILFSLFIYGKIAFSQCPESGMKFQGPQCEKPTNVGIKEISCSSLQVKWKGSKDQTYTIEASYIDPITSKEIIKVAASDIEIACSVAGNCTAVIPVKEGTMVNWSVQAKCKNGMYSDTLQGKEVFIPYCNELTGTVHLYPNPTTGNITVEYLGIHSGIVQFTVYDMKGEIVFNRIENTDAGVNTPFKFDLTDLAPGIYLLEARNEDDVKRVKFMIE